MRVFEHPSFIGALIVGIVFNLVLGILGLLGFALLDALWITSALLTIIGAGIVQHLIQTRKDEG